MPAVALAGSLGLGGGREEGERREGGSMGRFPPSILGKEARRAGIHGGGGQ